MIEGIDEWQCRGATKSPSIVESGGDTNRGLVDIGYTEVDFPHLHRIETTLWSAILAGALAAGCRTRAERQRRVRQDVYRRARELAAEETAALAVVGKKDVQISPDVDSKTTPTMKISLGEP